MKLKSFVNAAILIIGLGLVGWNRLGLKLRFNSESVALEPTPETPQQKFERWQLKPGSVYDGDTLRVVRGSEELKIRFCGIDAPELKQPLGIESRDYLRSLVESGNGELLLVPIEQDRYERTVAELYVQDRSDSAINLNLEMVRAGYAWHYAQYSDSCPMRDQLIVAEGMAKSEGVGIWNGNPQPPWEWRRTNK